MTTATDTHCLEHFVQLARSGSRQGASGGERRAARLAKAILADVPGLDDEAVQGMADFARFASGMPQTAAQLLGK